MKKIVLLSCVVCLLSPGNSHALDLNPHFVTRVTGSNSENVPYFTEGDTKYSMELPIGVSVSKCEGGAVFRLEAIEGTMTMRPSPFKPSDPFSGPALEAYRKSAMGLVQKGATGVSIKQETPDPLTCNGWSSYRIVLAYQMPGWSFLQSVTFLNFSAGQQILLITVAPEKHFKQAEAITYDLMKRWRTLRPGENIEFPPAL